jgi:membrane protein implicated in regulation of membrane protease activity
MKWRPIDFIVLIIITAILVALVAYVLKPYITGTANETATTQAASELVGALIAIVAIYVGSNLEYFKKNDND